MSNNKILKKLTEAVVEGGKETCEEYAKKALEQGMNPYETLMEGCAKGMNIISDKYDKKEAYVPDILLSAKALYAGMKILEPHIDVDSVEVSGKILLGVVEGDVHDIGKNVLKTILEAGGFEVIDLGKDVKSEDFLKAVEEEKPDILMISALMTTSMAGMPEIIDLLKKSGIRDQVKVMVGGGPITQEYADEVGADGYADNATQAKRVAEELLLEEKN